MDGFNYQMGLTMPTSPAPTGPAQGPQFSDIQKILTPQNNSQGISPEAANVMALINKQRDYYAGLGESAAKARATQFGNSGSSIEQFGIAQADAQANQSALGAESNVLTADMSNQLAQRQQLAGLTSDEIASLRNMGLSQQSLALQQSLGQQGINLGYQNLSQAAKLGQQQGTNQLIGSLAPLLFGGGGFGGFGGAGAGGSLFGNFAGNVSQAFGGGSLSGTAYGGAGAPASSLFPGGVVAPGATVGTGTGAGGLAFGGGASLGANLGGAGLGYVAGKQIAGDTRYTNTGAVIGGVGGSILGPVGTAAGTAIGMEAGKLANQAATTVSSKLGNTAGSALRYSNPLTAIPDSIAKLSNPKTIFGGKSNGTGSGDATSQAQQQLDSQLGTLQGLKARVASGQMTHAEYVAQAQPMVNQMQSYIQSMTSKNSAWANAINPKWQALLNSGVVGKGENAQGQLTVV